MTETTRHHMLHSTCRPATRVLVVAAILGGLWASEAGAAPTANGRVVYGNNTATPQNRAYTAATNAFGSAGGTVAGGIPSFMVDRAAPTRLEHIAGYVTTAGQLYVMRWDGTTWTNEWNVAVGGNGVDGRRFDIAYEATTGRAMVAYSNNTNSTLAYRIWSGSAWTTAATQASARLTGIPNAIKLAPRPVSGSNVIAATVADANNLLTTLIWSGSAWANEPASAHGTLGGTAGQSDLWDQSWETSTGDLMVVLTTGTPNQAWRLLTFASSTWGATTNFPNTGRAAPLQMVLASDPGSDQMVVAFNRSGSANVYAYQWSGTAWSTGTTAVATTGAAPAIEQRTVTASWLRSGTTSVAILMFDSTSGSNQVDWLYYNGTAWTAGSPFAGTFGGAKVWMDAATDPQSPDTLMLAFSTAANNSLWAKRLVYGGGTTFTWSNADGGSALGTVGSLTAQNFDFGYDRLVGSPPGSPGTPTYSSITSTGATVAWTAGSGATSYNLQRATDSGFTANLATFTGVASPYADASAPTGNTTYWYRAVAVNGSGSTNGAGSSVLVLPAAPAAPTFTSVTSTGVTVSWTPPAGGAVSYNVQRATDAGFTAGLATFTGVTSPWADAGPLTPGGTYYYRAVAVNASGSSPGAGASVVTLPGTPGTPTYSSITSAGATVAWTAATGATSYNLQRATDSGFTANLTNFTAVVSPYADASAPTANTTYWYRAVAVNAAGSTTGTGSSVLLLPAAPAAPTFTNVTSTGVTVSWTAPAGGAASYNVQRATDSGFGTNLATFTNVTSPYADAGPLTPGANYYYRVVAVNASGTSPGAGAVVTTLPGTPGTPTYSAVTYGGATVSWTAATGATSYNLQRALDGGFSSGLVTFTGVTSPYPDATLAGSTTYWYRAVAVSAGGTTTGGASSVTTPAGPPSAPAAPSFSAVAQTTLTVSWSPANGATSYNLQRALDSGFATGLTTVTGVTSPYPATGLTANTIYWYRVVAVNANGSTTGAAASVATLPNAPGAPGAPTYSGVSQGGVTVSWTAGTGATSYNLQRAADSGFTTAVATFTGVTSPYTDGSLSPNTTYWYRAVAVNAGGSTTGAGSSVTTLAAASLTVAAGTMPAGVAVAAGTPSTTVGRISLTSSGAAISVLSLAVVNGGTALPADVASVQLFNDTSGAWIASGTWTGTQYLFQNLYYSVSGTVTLRVTMGLSRGAITGRTFRMDVPASAVTVLAPNTVNTYTAFSGNVFTVGAGPTEGDATANSTGPVLRIVNPRDGGVVTLSPASATPASAFRAQVYVYNPGGVAALTSVTLSTDNGATWPITLAKNANYYPGDTLRGIWEFNVALAPGTWTLRARAVNTVPKTVVSAQVVVVVNPAGRGDGNLLGRDNAGQLCADCHALATHSSEATSSKYGSWSTDCRDCHTPHSTTNIYLVKQSITPPSVVSYQGAKAVKFSTTTGDSNSTAVASASFANSDNTGPCQVCHTRTADTTGTVARWRNTGNSDTHYTVAAGTQSCTGCHSHMAGFAGGESTGGAACAGCHKTIWQGMTGVVAKAYKHTLGATQGTNDSPTDSGLAWGNPLSANLPASRSCVNMCHVDHVHDNPATGTSHSWNASQDATSGATRAVTRNGSGVITAGTPDTTDYEGGPGYGTNANGGMCLSCHRNPVDASHPAVDKVAYDWSAHDYTSFSTYGPWQYTLHEGSTFNRNCTKCHADRADAQSDSTTPFGAVHFSDYPSLLAGTTNPAGAPATFVCYNCHGNGTTGTNLSGKDLATEFAKTGSGHPVNADTRHNSVTEAAPAYADGTFTGANRHVNCIDCHDQHAASNFKHLAGSNAVAGGAPYTTGTATFTSGSATVTGTGTAWTPYAGWKIRNDANGTWYQVASVASATSLTLTANYAGATASGAYTIASSSPLASATGVTYTPPATAWTATATGNFAFTASVTHEYEVCMKCHSSFGFGANPVASPSGRTYVTGTAAFTNGSATVTGTGTTWGATHVDMVVKNNADGIWYTVTAVASATSLTINRAYAGTTASGAYTLQERETDVAMEFSTSNQSYHPVVGALPATDPGANGSNQLTAAQLGNGWTPGKTMYCADCHGNDSNAPAAQGPHGSAVAFLLRRSNWGTVPAGSGTPGTSWPTSNGSTLYNLGSNPADGTILNGLFCLNCHPMRTSGANSAATWAGNIVHYNHSGPQVSSVNCTQCHILVPHGGKMGRLIATNSAGLPLRYAWQGTIGNVSVLQFKKAATPGGYATSNCNTNCSGHGTVTGVAADLPLSW